MINPLVYIKYILSKNTRYLFCRYSTTGPDGGIYYIQLCADAPQCVRDISMCHYDSSHQLHKLGESSSSVFIQDGKLTFNFVITYAHFTIACCSGFRSATHVNLLPVENYNVHVTYIYVMAVNLAATHSVPSATTYM